MANGNFVKPAYLSSSKRHFSCGLFLLAAAVAIQLASPCAATESNAEPNVEFNAESNVESNVESDIDFGQQIRPLLSDRCFHCHGPDEENLEGGLRLDQQSSAHGEADSGERAIVAGDPEASET